MVDNVVTYPLQNRCLEIVEGFDGIWNPRNGPERYDLPGVDPAGWRQRHGPVVATAYVNNETEIVKEISPDYGLVDVCDDESLLKGSLQSQVDIQSAYAVRKPNRLPRTFRISYQDRLDDPLGTSLPSESSGTRPRRWILPTFAWCVEAARETSRRSPCVPAATTSVYLVTRRCQKSSEYLYSSWDMTWKNFVLFVVILFRKN